MRADDALPTPYVNAVHAQIGLDDCFLTFGIAQPLDIRTDTDLTYSKHWGVNVKRAEITLNMRYG